MILDTGFIVRLNVGKYTWSMRPWGIVVVCRSVIVMDARCKAISQLGMSSSQLTFIFFRGVGLNHQPEFIALEIPTVFFVTCVRFLFVLRSTGLPRINPRPADVFSNEKGIEALRKPTKPWSIYLGGYSSNNHNLILFYGTLPNETAVWGLLIRGWYCWRWLKLVLLVMILAKTWATAKGGDFG